MPSLYQVEDDLQALLDTEEGGVSEEHQAELQRRIIDAYMAATDKRERVHQFLSNVEAMNSQIETEIKRLQGLKKSNESKMRSLENHIVGVICALGKDAKGKYKKLEGNTCVFQLRKSPDVVEVTDEAAVSSEYKTAKISMEAEQWEALIATASKAAGFTYSFPVEYEVSKRKAMEGLKEKAKSTPADQIVTLPGLQLKTERYSLERK